MDTTADSVVAQVDGPTTAHLETLSDALARVEIAVRAVVRGDPGPFTELWSHGEDSTLFGAFGPAKRGWRELEPVFPWVASRYRDGRLSVDYVTVVEGVDTAYTVGYERTTVSIDGERPAASTIRVTHIFRREQGRWMLVHRHGDFVPADGPSTPDSGSEGR